MSISFEVARKRTSAWRACAVMLAFAATGLNPASGQPVDTPATYGGDIWTRPKLTGSWGGVRDDLAKKGLVLEVDVTGMVQDVASGRETGASVGGVNDYTLNFDTGKAGLWPGGFLKIHALNGYGQNAIREAGTLVPVNGISLLPSPKEAEFAVPNVTVMQFFSPKAGVYFGKIETLLGGDSNEFADYNRNKFLYTGLEFNMTSLHIPISALGGGFVLLPWEGAVINLSVLDPNGEETTTGFDEPFNDGVMALIQARITVNPFGLKGHQLAGYTWTNKNYTSLEQDPSNIARFLLREQFPRLNDPGRILGDILERFFPGLLVPVAPLNVEHHAWNFFYNFDQYLWSPAGKADAGIGAFFRFGISDGTANPVKYAYNVGIGGKDIVPGRPLDTFGIGWARTQFSSDFVPFLRDNLDLGLKHEDAVELYYNFGITPWFNVTADLQVVMPGINKNLNSSGALEDADTAVVVGLRSYVRF